MKRTHRDLSEDDDNNEAPSSPIRPGKRIRVIQDSSASSSFSSANLSSADSSFSLESGSYDIRVRGRASWYTLRVIECGIHVLLVPMFTHLPAKPEILPHFEGVHVIHRDLGSLDPEAPESMRTGELDVLEKCWCRWNGRPSHVRPVTDVQGWLLAFRDRQGQRLTEINLDTEGDKMNPIKELSTPGAGELMISPLFPESKNLIIDLEEISLDQSNNTH